MQKHIKQYVEECEKGAKYRFGREQNITPVNTEDTDDFDKSVRAGR